MLPPHLEKGRKLIFVFRSCLCSPLSWVPGSRCQCSPSSFLFLLRCVLLQFWSSYHAAPLSSYFLSVSLFFLMPFFSLLFVPSLCLYVLPFTLFKLSVVFFSVFGLSLFVPVRLLFLLPPPFLSCCLLMSPPLPSALFWSPSLYFSHRTLTSPWTPRHQWNLRLVFLVSKRFFASSSSTNWAF